MLALIESDPSSAVAKELTDEQARGYVAQGFSVSVMGENGARSAWVDPDVPVIEPDAEAAPDLEPNPEVIQPIEALAEESPESQG